MNHDDKLCEKIRAQLDHDAQQLDVKTRFQLAQARNMALQGSSARKTMTWRITGMMSTATVALLVIVLWQQPPVNTLSPTEINGDFELLTAEQDIDFYEDMDFYAWLAKNNVS